VILDADRFAAEFLRAAHPADQPLGVKYYVRLFNVVAAIQPAPQRICEIGTRAGYSAFTFAAACPSADIISIEADLDETLQNTHTGRKGMWRHAVAIMPPERFQLWIVNSRHVIRLPQSDLIYIDGDHTAAGCLLDLQLAAQSTDRIIVDDYLVPNLQVKPAVELFLRHFDGWQMTLIDDVQRGICILERIASE
jgi:predicted O-methyltransferase YrrM